MVTLMRHFGMSGAELPENAWEPIFGLRSELFENMSKMGPEKIVYASGTFWDVRCRMTWKRSGTGFWAEIRTFWKNVKSGSGKKLFTLLGHFGMSGAEWPENVWKPIFGSRSATFWKMSKIGPEKICLRFWGILGCQVQNDLKTLGKLFLGRDLNFSGKREGANNLGGSLWDPTYLVEFLFDFWGWPPQIIWPGRVGDVGAYCTNVLPFTRQA